MNEPLESNAPKESNALKESARAEAALEGLGRVIKAGKNSPSTASLTKTPFSRRGQVSRPGKGPAKEVEVGKSRRPIYNARFDAVAPLISNSVKREILKRITRGHSMREIAEDPKLPKEHEIYDLIHRDPDFATAYRAARLARASVWAEEIREKARRAEDCQNMGKEALAYVHAIRLQIDTDKWLLSRLLPAEYGEKQVDSPTERTVTGVLEVIKLVTGLVREKPVIEAQVVDATPTELPRQLPPPSEE